jgi:cell division protein FtsX
MRVTLLQEAMAAGPFLLIGLIVGLIGIFLIFFLGAKVIKLREVIKELANGDDVQQLKEKRTQFVFWLSVLLFLTVGLIGMVVKFWDITFD